MNSVFALIFAIILVGCTPAPNENRNPELEEMPSSEIGESREATQRDAASYREALELAPKYRSDLRDVLIENSARYRHSGNTGLRVFWSGKRVSQRFGCIHPVQAIAQARQDGWQLVKCDQYTAYFLRGPHVEASERTDNKTAPTLEQSFEILRITFDAPSLRSEAKERYPYRRALYASMPDIYQQPTRSEILKSGFAPETEDEIRVAYYDFKRRKEISILDASAKTVVTLISEVSNVSDLYAAKGMQISGNSVVRVESPSSNYDEMVTLLNTVKTYVGENTVASVRHDIVPDAPHLSTDRLRSERSQLSLG